MTSLDEIRHIVRSEIQRLRDLEEEASQPLPFNQAARKLGMRKEELRRLVRDGKIQTIPWVGKKTPFRIPASEIARVQREGIPSVAAAPTPKRGRPKKTAGGPTDSVSAQVARLKAFKVH